MVILGLGPAEQALCSAADEATRACTPCPERAGCDKVATVHQISQLRYRVTLTRHTNLEWVCLLRAVMLLQDLLQLWLDEPHAVQIHGAGRSHE